MLLTIAVQHRVNRGVEDPDQAWILGELIRYLEHPKSGALDFSDMGRAWTDVRQSVAAGTLRNETRGSPNVGTVGPAPTVYSPSSWPRTRNERPSRALRKDVADPEARANAHERTLVTDGILTGSIRIPDAVAPIDITADIRGGRIIVSTDLAAPREGRPTTRVNWLVRQLAEAPGGLRIDVWAGELRSSTSELLSVVRDNPASLIADPKKELRTFRIVAVSPMGTKRATGRGSFIDSVLNGVEAFYGNVLQQVRPWAAKPPQLSKAVPAGDEVALPPSAPTDFENPPIGHTGGPVVSRISRSESVASSAAKHLSHVRHRGRLRGVTGTRHRSRRTTPAARPATDATRSPTGRTVRRGPPVRNNVDAVRRVGPVPTWTVRR